MANVKISGLPAATSVTAGTDVAPLVSGGITTKATPQQIVNAGLLAPGAIGSGTASTGAFTTLSASSTVSGTGFSTYLLSPPAIGTTAPAAGKFTDLTSTGNTTIGDASTDTFTVYPATVSLINSTAITAASTKTLTLNGGAGSNGLVLDASNNVGINTSSPGARLDVRATSFTPASTTASILVEDKSSWTQGLQFYIYNAGTFNSSRPSGGLGPANSTEMWLTSGSLTTNNTGAASGITAYSTAASIYRLGSGAHYWYGDTGLTAGNTYTQTQRMTLGSSGDLTISGSTATKASGTTWANPSDTRLKDNQQIYEKGLNELSQIIVKTWDFNGKGGSSLGTKGIGVIADEIEQILPDCVDTYKAKLNDDDEKEIDIKRFDASEIIWLLVNSVKELSAQNNALEDRLTKLEAK